MFAENYCPPPDRPEWPLRAADAVVPLPRNHGYDLALSFAGEDREVARVIAHTARANGLHVFFDEYHLWESWGKDLSDYLGSIYGGGARFCVILISKDYCQKPYTNFERRTALGHALESEEEYVLPVVLDESWPPGLPRTTAYLDLRVMEPAEVAKAIVLKIKGQDCAVQSGKDQLSPKFEVLKKDMSRLPDTKQGKWPGVIDFADVAIANECRLWTEGDPYVQDPWPPEPAHWSFRGGCNEYADPIFDVVILNRSDASRLITRVGIEARGASFRGYDGFGGGLTEAVLLHRTYQIPVPDLWQTLAERLRAAGGSRLNRQSMPWMDMAERSSCRLPDPILIDPGKAYRFGLHLFDYTSFCPTEVELLFWVQTDLGMAKSRRARLSYFIGSTIPPVQRYLDILQGESDDQYVDNSIERVANAGRETVDLPEVVEQYMRTLAESNLRERREATYSMQMAHKRTL
jgi:hypothetical protein